MPDFIKLPSERVEQLRQLSHNRQMPIADLIADYVRSQIEAGQLTRDVPGIAVRKSGHVVEIDFGDFKRELTAEVAQAYAETLRLFARPKSRAPMLTDALEGLGGASTVGIARRGTAIKITGDNGGVRIVAPSIAVDLAEVIERVAAQSGL